MAELKKVINAYNLHQKVLLSKLIDSKRVRLTKEELVQEMLKHLEVDLEGIIRLKQVEHSFGSLQSYVKPKKEKVKKVKAPKVKKERVKKVKAKPSPFIDEEIFEEKPVLQQKQEMPIDSQEEYKKVKKQKEMIEQYMKDLEPELKKKKTKKEAPIEPPEEEFDFEIEAKPKTKLEEYKGLRDKYERMYNDEMAKKKKDRRPEAQLKRFYNLYLKNDEKVQELEKIQGGRAKRSTRVI
jgi:hypothetical protein